MSFEEFRRSKKFKDDSEIYTPTEEDFNKMSDFEKTITSGRYLLEKKTRLKIQNQAKILNADFCATKDSKLLVLGFSNGQFSIYNIDTLDHIHSF